ncbi:MAG TPA: carbonic anhydrase [Nitrososphaeraceae archaeon]|jgi:carbonic anhydrase|nr:carbonic anhydrase [Nitrososphaeraceae archaeon]
MAKGKFATSVSCMDGRIQIPITNWIKENFSVDYVDTITEPGIDKLVADNTDLESIKTKVGISINKHESELIVVSGHYDCAGNPVSNEEHITQIKKGIEVISSWNLGVKVVGVWVDDTWKINTV